MAKQKAGIYFHVPFCRGKCPYCDFYSREFSLRSAQLYVRAAAQQIDSFPRLQVDSAYFGGGTPSLLSAGQIYSLLESARERFVFSADCEITMEANPADIDPKRLPYYIDAGINRLSIGVQSLEDDTLAALGRRHTAEQARAAVQSAFDAGIKNISADLMLAVPGMTTQGAARAARNFAALPVCHVSAYMLKLNPGTPFGDNPPAGLPDDDTAADQYIAVEAELERGGFEKYEISNFARDGHTSRHNLKYWQCADYAGIGPAAHSCIGGERFSCPPDLDTYLQQDFSLPYAQYLHSEGAVTAEDLIICSLRTTAGLDLEQLKSRFGFEFSAGALEETAQLCERGFMINNNGVLSLTQKGMLVSNSILSDLI